MRLFHGALVLSLFFTSALDAAAQAAKDVNVANTPNVNVVNNPGVQVTNTPNVSVMNTPNVNVANTPNVNVLNTPSVNVTNTPNVNVASLPAVQVSSLPAVQLASPAIFRQVGFFPISGFGGFGNDAVIPAVPGTRAEIKFVTVSCPVAVGGGSIISIDILTYNQAQNFSYVYPAVVHASAPSFGFVRYFVSEAVTLFSDRSQVGLIVGTSDTGSINTTCQMNVSGNLINP
jgi:hypothetical protein